MNYNEKNKHPRDCRISFDAAGHQYTATSPDGTRIDCDSVTTIVERCFEQFDADYWAERKATPEKSADVLKAEWAAKGEQARDLGTRLHDRIERHYLGETPDPEALSDPAFRNFLVFADRHPLKPFRSEWRIFSEKYRVAGTLDFLAFDGTDFEIYDWKRSSKIINPYTGHPDVQNCWGKHAFAPVSHLHDTIFWHYALQVSIYRYILETEYGIMVKAGHLGTFHPDYTCPYVVDVPYLRDEVILIFESRL